MAKFLSTAAASYHLEELMKGARERLILISPYLKLSERMRPLLEDQDRMKIDIRIVYGKQELQPEESNWLRSLRNVKTSFCKNLHAKCYLNESQAIITSMNLYEYSQVNNEEMGILLVKEEDVDLYRDTYDAVQRLIRISEDVMVTVEHVAKSDAPSQPKPPAAAPAPSKSTSGKMISTTQLAKLLGTSAKVLFEEFYQRGWIDRDGKQWILTRKGEQNGGQIKHSKDYGDYIVWPEDLA